MKKSLTKKSKKGFTLIELVVVIAILGILAAILIPVISGFIQRANDAADQANARGLFNAASMVLAVNDTALAIDTLGPTELTTAGVDDLFGTIPTGSTVVVVAAGSGRVVQSAQVNGWTYNPSNDPMFSGS
ncbi:MAG: prepilin-type N-terminal cleavage/methylation domain-containing protein [Bacillota bacterium]|nr:prepilin-type N-terminal cleavage/methylation domain-containing protein [Bacillota bacterium]